MWGILSFVILLGFSTISAESVAKGYYVASVVELSAEDEPRPENVAKNVEPILQLIKEAKNQGADIAVFPELALTGYETILPSMAFALPAHERFEPLSSNETDERLMKLARAARDNQIYVVVNIAEAEICTRDMECPSNGEKIYNTNIVLDRTGSVISRYRKFRLFDETASIPVIPDPVYFDTDFNVRFTMATCFDLLFERPILTAVNELGITDVVFPTAWFHQLPFQSSMQYQSAWAYAADVNLLAAGYNYPAAGVAGSAIHLGRQGLANFTLLEHLGSRMVTSRVPIKPPRAKHSFVEMQEPDDHPELKKQPNTGETVDDPFDVKLKEDKLWVRQDDLSEMTTLPIHSHVSQKLCHGRLCCHFNVTIEGNHEEYRAVVFHGLRTFLGFSTGGYQLCGLVACSNQSIHSCGLRFPTTSTIRHVEIMGNFLAVRATTMPSTIMWNTLTPLTVDRFDFQKSCKHVQCWTVMNLKKPTQGLLTFAIHGRVFSLDGRPLKQ